MKNKLAIPKPVKFNKTKAKNKLDKLFSLSVRAIGYCQAEDKYPPVKCGGSLQCAHIENRSNITLRWDKNNVLCLCFGHHFWFHRHPLQFVEFLLEYYKEKYDYVVAHRNEKTQFNEIYYKEKLKELT